jgi:hypothetical protein
MLEKSLSGSGSVTTRAMGSRDVTPGPSLFRFDTSSAPFIGDRHDAVMNNLVFSKSTMSSR